MPQKGQNKPTPSVCGLSPKLVNAIKTESL